MNNHTTILIADSGSTKTDWALVTSHLVPRTSHLAPRTSYHAPRTSHLEKLLHTQGINPVHQDEQTIRHILNNELKPQLDGLPVAAVYFYGSGVRPTEEPLMQRLLQETLATSQQASMQQEVPAMAVEVEAHSDLLGAARALCGRHEGLACILGTGANSCLYNGSEIVSNTPPLGYVLGDEGSGAVLGIRFLNALYKGVLPDALRREFEDEQGLSLADVINRVYRQPMPNRFLASLSPFIHARRHLPALNSIVVENFRLFLQRNVNPYGRHDLPLAAVGSVAFYYQEQLAQAAAAEGYTLGHIERTPLQGLVNYHLVTQ